MAAVDTPFSISEKVNFKIYIFTPLPGISASKNKLKWGNMNWDALNGAPKGRLAVSDLEHRKHLGILLKYWFWVSRSGWDLKVNISKKPHTMWILLFLRLYQQRFRAIFHFVVKMGSPVYNEKWWRENSKLSYDLNIIGLGKTWIQLHVGGVVEFPLWLFRSSEF